MVRPELAIVIPSFNEAATIAKVVESVKPFGLPIVVSDGSTDDTAAIARAAGAHVVDLKSNVGYDGALNAGFAAAYELEAEFVLTMDADGQHPEHLIPVFLDLLRHSAHVVVGRRDRLQRVGERFFAWIGRLIFDVEDPLCGMKGYCMPVYSAQGYFDVRRSIGTELALFAVRNGFRVQQIDVPTRDRLDQPRFGRTLRANFRIFRAALLALAKGPLRYEAKVAFSLLRKRDVLSYGKHNDFFLFSPDSEKDALSTIKRLEAVLEERPDYISLCDFGVHVPAQKTGFQDYRTLLGRLEIEELRKLSYGELRDIASGAPASKTKAILLNFHELATVLLKALVVEKLYSARKTGPTVVAAPAEVVNVVFAREISRRLSACSTALRAKVVGRPATAAWMRVLLVAAAWILVTLGRAIHWSVDIAFLVVNKILMIPLVVKEMILLVRNKILMVPLVTNRIWTIPHALNMILMIPTKSGQNRRNLALAWPDAAGKRVVIMVVEDSGTRVNLDPALKIAASLISRGVVPLVLSRSACVVEAFGQLQGAVLLEAAATANLRNSASLLYASGEAAGAADLTTAVNSSLSPVAELGRRFKLLTRLMDIQAVLTVYETLPLCVEVGFWAREAGYPWIGFFPILVGDRPDGHLFCADHHLVYGEQLADMLVSDGVAAANVHVVGSPTYDRFHGYHRGVEKGNLVRQFPKAMGKVVIAVATEAFPEPLVELDPILRTLSQDARYHVILKLHPEDSLDFFNSFVATLPGRERIDVVKAFPLEPLLAGCDLLICIISNIAVSASVIGTPVLICDFSGKSSAIDFVAEGLCFGCKDPEQLAAAVENIVGNADYQAAVQTKISRHIARFNGPNDGRSCERIADFVLSIKRNGAVVPRRLFYPTSRNAVVSAPQPGSRETVE